MSANSFYVIFQIKQQPFAVKLQDVVRIIRIVQITPIPQAPEVIEGVINVQGEVIPVVNLRKRFSISERGVNLEDHIILINSKDRLLGLLVDEVTDIMESPGEDVVAKEKNIVPGADRIQGFVKTENSMILIQDLDTLLSMDEEKILEQSIKQSAKVAK